MDFEKLKAEIRSPEFKEKLRANMREKMIRFNEEANQMIALHYPDHVGHTWTEGDWEYFDAMFISYTLNCSCGAKLKVTRAMLDDKE